MILIQQNNFNLIQRFSSMFKFSIAFSIFKLLLYFVHLKVNYQSPILNLFKPVRILTIHLNLFLKSCLIFYTLYIYKYYIYIYIYIYIYNFFVLFLELPTKLCIRITKAVLITKVLSPGPH